MLFRSDILRIREEVSEAKLRDWCEQLSDAARSNASVSTDPSKIPGAEYEAPGERLTPYRR